MKINIMIIVFFSFFISCKPEEEATVFNQLAELKAGDDMVLDVEEDSSLLIEYNIPAAEVELSNVELEVTKLPENGKLSECEKKSLLTFQCEYTPNKNFNGQDIFSFKVKDGDLASDKDSIIKINVTAVNDKPLAISKAYSGKENEYITFSIPQGEDIDTSANNLTYRLLDSPENGVLSNCLVGAGTRTCTYLANQDFRGSETLKYVIEDDHGALSNEGELLIQVMDPDTTETTEIFTQGVSEIEFVEIVWVIDNSGSMGNDQTTLKNNFQSFINNFLVDGKSKFPFKMGVITSDTYHSKYENKAFSRDADGNVYNLTSQRADTDFAGFKSDFEKAVLVGTSGSGIEKSFDSIKKSRQFNPSWYSETDSLLVFIVVSDEKEQSFSIGSVSNQEQHNTNIDEWLALFNNWKTQENRIKVFPIINKSADSFDRYKLAAEKTSSDLFDLSSPFTTILDSISTTVSNLVNSFPLKQDYIIEEDTIVVKIDDIVNTDWVYVDGAITFTIPPAQGKTIKVDYKYYERNF